MHRIAAIAVLFVATGCASAGPEANLSRFQRNVGQATPQFARELTMRIITQHGFVVEQEEGIPNMVIQTRWRPRAPFPDEEALGIQSAQNRMIILARPRSATNNALTYNVDLVIENRVQLMGSEAWTQASATPEYEKWAEPHHDGFHTRVERWRREAVGGKPFARVTGAARTGPRSTLEALCAHTRRARSSSVSCCSSPHPARVMRRASCAAPLSMQPPVSLSPTWQFSSWMACVA